MRGVFDQEEQERLRSTSETELTLGSGMLLAMFFGLIVLCGLCFGMGYAMGHSSAGSPAATAPQPATDQEPLQASGNIPKPSAIAQTPVTPPDQPAADQAPANPAGAPAQPATSTGGAAGGAESQPQVHAALSSETAPQTPAAAGPQAVHPALASQPLMVQIAAVSNPDDAEVLVNALRKRNYPVTERRGPGDDYIHVRIGPFATRALAEQWKSKLLNDGYNAVIQP